MGKLESRLAYDLIGKKYPILPSEQDKINANPPILNSDWEKNFCSKFKVNIKKFFARKQNRRCAYCRSIINVDGYTDPIEHIVPRIRKPKWMFVQHNLVVSCGGCNSAKGDENTLRNHENSYGHEDYHSPVSAAEYKVFNPHFEKWSDHFEIQDEFFLVPKPNTKGPYTYNLCNMSRYQIIIDYRDSLSLDDKKSLRALIKRINRERDSDKIIALKEAKEYVLDIIENN